MTALARTRRTTRIAGMLGACALAVVALTGCIKVDADLSIDADAKASGSFAMELQKEAAGFMGISDLASFETQMTSGELSGDSGLGIFDACETSESDTGYVYTCTFTATEFTDPDEGPWTIAKDGSSIVFRMVSEGQSEGDAADAASLMGDASMGSINVDVTFPGAITAMTGTGATKTSDTTATISGSLTDTIDVTITSDASSGGLSKSILLVLLVAVAILVLIVIVVVVLVTRRRKGPGTEPVDAAAATAGGLAAGEAGVFAEATPDAAETAVVEEVVTEATPDAAETAVVEEVVTEAVAETETVAADQPEDDPQPPA